MNTEPLVVKKAYENGFNDGRAFERVKAPRIIYMSYQDEEDNDYTWGVDSRLEPKIYDLLVSQGYKNIISRL